MPVEIKGKKCRNIQGQVAFNSYRLDQIIGQGIQECIHKLGNEAVSGEPYHFPYYFTASFDNATRNLKVKLWTITLDNNKTLAEYEQEVHIPGGGAGGDAVWGDITGTITNQTDLMNLINGKSHVSVSAAGTATDEVQYITIDGVEKKLAGGGSGEPAEYLKSVDTGTVLNQLVFTKKDDTTQTFDVDLSAYRTSAAQDTIDAGKQPLIDAEHKIPYTNISGTPDLSGYVTTDTTEQRIAGWKKAFTQTVVVDGGAGTDAMDVCPGHFIWKQRTFNIPIDTTSPADVSALALRSDLATGTNDGTNWTTLTIGGVTKNIPSGGGSGEPAAYLKSADVSTTNTLKLKNKDNTDTTFTVDFSAYRTAADQTIIDNGFEAAIEQEETDRIAADGVLQTAIDTKANDADVVKLAGDQEITGNKKFKGSDGCWAYYNNAVNTKYKYNCIDATVTGVTYQLSFPMKNGTIALTSDIPTDYVALTGNQTITGIKTFPEIWVGEENDYGKLFTDRIQRVDGTNTYEYLYPAKNGTIAMVSDCDEKIAKTTTIETVWSGTLAEYNAITSKDVKTLYNITDDNGLFDQLPVGAIYEAEGDDAIAPSYGTWTALSDRIEDKWKEHTFSCINNGGAISYPKFLAKVTEDKQYVDIQLRFTMQVNNVTATAEIEVANNLKLDGIVWGNIFEEMTICNFADGNNATQAGTVYLSNGSNKIWFGPYKTGGYYGTCTLRKLIPYRSVFTPDKVIKRWKRTA